MEKSYEEDIQHRVNDDFTPELRGKYGAYIALGAIADKLARIVELLEQLNGKEQKYGSYKTRTNGA